uniref:hypothetical protein n=1 Tax=Mesorhizobium atlanticum TaxID=2233532 RepID=UPI003703F974
MARESADAAVLHGRVGDIAAMITLFQTAMPRIRIGRRSFPFEYYILKIVGPAAECPGECTVVGYLADRPIFATVMDSSGERYHYVGRATRLSDGQYDVESPRLVSGSSIQD